MKSFLYRLGILLKVCGFGAYFLMVAVLSYGVEQKMGPIGQLDTIIHMLEVFTIAALTWPGLIGLPVGVLGVWVSNNCEK
jgi:hypothetical protein